MPKLRARIDISKASLLSEVELGKSVTVCVVGKVIEMRGESQYMYTTSLNGKKKEKSTTPGELVLEITNFKVDSKGEFIDPEEEDD